MSELSKAQLSEYDFRILIDASGSMAEPWNGSDRWHKAGEIAKAVAEFAGAIDENGIDVIVFGGVFDKEKALYKNTSADKVYQIFHERGPQGSTPLAEAIHLAVQLHKEVGGKKSFHVVVTDGAPNNQEEVINALTAFSNSLHDKKDSTFLFLQIGNDESATAFLNKLDTDLKGAKFDIVCRKSESDWRNMSFEQLFYVAQNS